MSKPDQKPFAKAVSSARNKIKVKAGLKILVTPEIETYWRNKLAGLSPYPPSAVLMVFGQNQDHSWNVAAPDAEKAMMAPLAEPMVRAGAVAHQVMQLGYTAEKFFRAVADKAGGIYQGMQRLKGEGWVGRVLMTPDKEHPDEPMVVPGVGVTEYPWIFTSVLPDVAMEGQFDVVPEVLIEGYAQQLALSYAQYKRHEQPKELVQ